MPGKSTKTKVITFRVSNEVYDTIKKRMLKTNYQNMGDYLRNRVTYDTQRKHGTSKAKRAVKRD